MIDRPVDPLKDLQRRVYEVLLKPIRFTGVVQGGVAGRSHLTNASRHLGSAKIAKTDIRRCFPSISHQRVFQVWLKICGHGPKVASVLTKLTTYRGHLPQGSSSSQALANLALLEVDRRIHATCPGRVTYSRYVDDLVVSGPEVGDSLFHVTRILATEGFQVAREKTGVYGRSTRQIVTGLTVNSGRLSAPRWRDSDIRSAIHKLKRTNPGSLTYDQQLCRIQGKIGNIRLTNEARAEYLERCLASALRRSDIEGA